MTTDLLEALNRWQLDVAAVRTQMYRAPTPRERERWHALWLAAQGWPAALAFVQTGGSPPALNAEQQAALKAAVQRPPREAGIDLADWNWKVVRRFVQERFGITLARSSCLNYLHRLGFVSKRPKKRLLKADEAKREAFGAEYTSLRVEAAAT